MKKIPLSQGLFAIVDDEDYERVSKYKWFALKDKHTFYAIRSIRKNGRQSKQKMHRLILKMRNSKILIDHINKNGIDNRKKNLRKASSLQNSHNRKIPITNTTGFRGVHWRKDIKKFASYININRKKTHLGIFPTAKLASITYECAAKKHFGKFYSPSTK
jgi:hypothetical protein